MTLNGILRLSLLLLSAVVVHSRNPLIDKNTFIVATPQAYLSSRANSIWGSALGRVSRGGSSPQAKKKKRKKVSRSRPPSLGSSVVSDDEEDPFVALARALQPDLEAHDDKEDGSTAMGSSSRRQQVSVDRIVDAFQLLSSAQQAFKGLDGAAHEAYQRTHPSQSSSSVDPNVSGSSSANPKDLVAVSGRASRSAARAGAVADGLGACELCELVESPHVVLDHVQEDGGSNASTTLTDRVVLVNETFTVPLGRAARGANSRAEDELTFRVLVLHEPDYRGGAGVEHGGVAPDEDDGGAAERVTKRRRFHGRLLVIIGDAACRSLGQTITALARSGPVHVRLRQGSEAGSVQPALYKAAAAVLERVEQPLRTHNFSAVHIVGRSLAGGVASLAGSILHGSIPMPSSKHTAKGGSKKRRNRPTTAKDGNQTVSSETPKVNGTADDSDETPPPPPLHGLCAGWTSVLTLGAPPCMSPNIPADFITSIVYGDDVVCRASHSALRRLVDRTRRNLDAKGGSIGRSIHWVSDTLSLAASGLKSHAHGSEGEEARLAVPGRAFLVRPRRLGDACSMHEIGSQLKGGREALRAAMLWQLNDVLLSRSMWRHHQLESYIHGLDKVQLRAVDQESA